MNASSCTSPLAWDDLLGYWLGEFDPDGEARVEEHYLGCAACSRRLETLVELAHEARALTARGGVGMVINEHFLRQLVGSGLKVREYRVPRNGSVNCTVAPGDDIVVARLDVPLDEVRRLDLVTTGTDDGWETRQADIPFIAGSGGVLVCANIDMLRALPATTLQMSLLAVDSRGERTLGEYTFHHAPYPSDAGK